MNKKKLQKVANAIRSCLIGIAEDTYQRMMHGALESINIARTFAGTTIEIKHTPLEEADYCRIKSAIISGLDTRMSASNGAKVK